MILSEIASNWLSMSGTRLVVIAGLVVGLGTGLLLKYYFGKRSKRLQEEEGFQYLKTFYQEKLETTQELVREDRNKQIIRLKTLDAIYELAILVEEKKLQKALLDCRRERRAMLAIHDMDAYETIIADSAETVEVLFRSATELILELLSLPKCLFSESTKYWISTDEKISLMSFALYQKIKARLVSASGVSISAELGREILEYELNLHASMSYTPKSGPRELLQQMSYVSDKVYEKYEIEEEDICDILLRDNSLVDVLQATIDAIGTKALESIIHLAYETYNDTILF